MLEQLRTGIEVTASCSVLSLPYRLRPVVVQIDYGPLQKMEWGSQFIEQHPGRHHVKVYIEGAIFGAEFAANSIDVVVEEGKVTKINYEAPVWVWQLKGPIKGEAPAPAVSIQSPPPVSQPLAVATAPEKASEITGATCSQCGARLSPGARFCHECGASVPQPRACPACGQLQPSGIFCSQCGAKLSDLTAAAEKEAAHE
jgi:ribosomal protein L40E